MNINSLSRTLLINLSERARVKEKEIETESSLRLIYKYLRQGDQIYGQVEYHVG